jgi:hypothetical protein
MTDLSADTSDIPADRALLGCHRLFRIAALGRHHGIPPHSTLCRQ